MNMPYARSRDPEKGLATGGNRILNELSADEAERLGRHLTRKSFELGDPLLRPGDPIESLIFPTTAMVSAMGNTPHGEQAEFDRSRENDA